MTDGWFDRSYRSDETPPAELDARVLAAARRATRRWTVPAVSAGALTITAVAVLGFLITGHELYVPPHETPRFDSTTDGDGFGIDLVEPSGKPERLSPPEELAPPRAHPDPGGIPTSNLQAESEDGRQPHRTSPELDCARSVLIGPLSGPEHRDLIQICNGDGTLYIDVVWDGEPACPSRFELHAPSDTPVRLDGSDLVIAQTRYRCEENQWITTGREQPGDPSAGPRE